MRGRWDGNDEQPASSIEASEAEPPPPRLVHACEVLRRDTVDVEGVARSIVNVLEELIDCRELDRPMVVVALMRSCRAPSLAVYVSRAQRLLHD
jgi:hypothetical protein